MAPFWLSAYSELEFCLAALFVVVLGYGVTGAMSLPSDRPLALATRLVAIVDVLVVVLVSASLFGRVVVASTPRQQTDNECCLLTYSHLHVVITFAWLVFVLAILRAATFILTLHTIDDAVVLVDIARGVGLLCISLIYTFPVVLVGFINFSWSAADGWADVCVQLSPAEPPAVSPLVCMHVAGVVGVVVVVLTVGPSAAATWSTTKALLIAVSTHLLPIYFLCGWIGAWLNNQTHLAAPEVLPVATVAVVAFGSLCTCQTLIVIRSTVRDCAGVAEYTKSIATKKDNATGGKNGQIITV